MAVVRTRRASIALSAAALLAALAGSAAAAPGDVAVVSLSGAGALGNQPAEASSASADGRFVAFTSSAALTGVSTNNNVQLYVRDRVARHHGAGLVERDGRRGERGRGHPGRRERPVRHLRQRPLRRLRLHGLEPHPGGHRRQQGRLPQGPGDRRGDAGLGEHGRPEGERGRVRRPGRLLRRAGGVVRQRRRHEPLPERRQQRLGRGGARHRGRDDDARGRERGGCPGERHHRALGDQRRRPRRLVRGAGGTSNLLPGDTARRRQRHRRPQPRRRHHGRRERPGGERELGLLGHLRRRPVRRLRERLQVRPGQRHERRQRRLPPGHGGAGHPGRSRSSRRSTTARSPRSAAAPGPRSRPTAPA